jgi:hypothetical protein
MTPATNDATGSSQEAARPYAVRPCLALAAAAYSYLALVIVLIFLVAMFENLIPISVAYWFSKARDFVIAPLGSLDDDNATAIWVVLLLILSFFTFRRSRLLIRRRLLSSRFWRIVNLYVLVTSALVLGGLLCVVGLFLLMAVVFAPLYLWH